jgi:hypothetical protein
MEVAMVDTKFSIYDNGFYKYVVEFEKAFQVGNLQGLTVKDRIHFIEKQDAEEWIQAVSGLNRDAKFSNFKIVEAA